MKTAKILCNVCGSDSIIKRTERVHTDLSRLYCICKNKECNHRFVMSMEFSHSTRASDLKKDEILKTLLDQLPETNKREIIQFLQGTMNEHSRT
ncbi:ogr/Delta-like zinc finger family protein [Aggregatibacter actinomycetemcomitans]|uniref:ogr/Delta-like zinc finger family protein n=1 Tax=Aggregatibacter actinomycetemcomitans TaxID=714 RepID=UPI00197B7D97|nr:ogr/Delta-like zinc finger family protein [Aggregatibacter actinomycetemcomitans]MBN6076444.1 ogr/Delta-like zinc finger family protein [Aggregatibacter actinomycetemcomitans]MBN6081885.1 ogr/Delta-like zinc finger family protein [Aggregatibacter actinomycetemcomitans]MBN6084175.1 ogr/Delta-like zinc finger family protein [Aggregatibacter actinomycetemcomitans]